jgi:hypothetical protein
LPPPKAPAAQAKTGSVYSSLVDALNRNQAKLVRDRKQEIADRYIIEFAPPDLAASGLKKPGEVNSDNTAMQANNIHISEEQFLEDCKLAYNIDGNVMKESMQ